VVGHGVASSCAIAAGESGRPASGKVVLRLGWLEDPDNLNPFVGYSDSSYEIWSLQYDYLFAERPDGTHGPELASERPTKENGGISPDDTVWTVRIRPGVKWHDGQPLTAEDVAFTYNYIVKGGLWNFTMLTAGIDHAEAVDPTTVRIVCTKPKADLLVACSAIPIVPKHIWEGVKPSVAQSSYVTKPPLVGSGPFQVVKFKKGVLVRMVRNPAYWGEEPVVDEIIFETYTNADTLAQDLKLHAIAAAEGIPRAQFVRLKDDVGFGSSEWNVSAFDYLTLNCKEGPSKGNPVLRDREVRRALAMAIDRHALVETAWNGLAEPGVSIINPGIWSDPDFHWRPPPGEELAFDLAGARRTLDSAGYRDSDGDGVREDKNGRPIKLRLWAATNNPQDQLQGKLIAGWWKDIGIGVEFQILDIGAIDDHYWNFEGDTYTPDYDAYMSMTLGYLDPGQTVPWFTTAQIGNWNEPCWSNDEYDRLSDEQVSTMDPMRRAEMIWRMQELMYEEAVYPVLAYPFRLQAYDTGQWEGWEPLGYGGRGGGSGPVFYTTQNVETYLHLRPVEEGGGRSRSQLTAVVAVAVAVVVVVVGAVSWALVRRRSRREETLE